MSAPLDAREPAEALARLDRRGFLRLAAAAAAVGVLPAGCGGVPARLVPPDPDALRVLSPRGYATFQALAMRVGGPPVAAAVVQRQIDPALAADAWVARLPPALGGTLSQGLALLEWGPWPLLPKMRPFTALGGDAQDRVIASLADSRLDLKRDLFRGLKGLATLVVYASPVARTWTGQPGPFDGAGIAAAMRW